MLNGVISSYLSGSCISVVTSGREATRGWNKRRSVETEKREISEIRSGTDAGPLELDVRVLVRLQRRKHNLIIMYGHISRMSPCLGQCTRDWCSAPTRFWHGGGVHTRIFLAGLSVSGGPKPSKTRSACGDHLGATFATLRDTCAYHFESGNVCSLLEKFLR